MSFFGLRVEPGKEKPLVANPGDIFHLSMIAFPCGTSGGKSTLLATVGGRTFTLATLNANDKSHQVAVDLIFPMEQKPVFSVKGSTPLDLTGYTQDFGPPEGGDTIMTAPPKASLPVASPMGLKRGRDDEPLKSPLDRPPSKMSAPAQEDDDEDLDDEDLDEFDDEDLDEFDDEDLDEMSDDDEQEAPMAKPSPFKTGSSSSPAGHSGNDGKKGGSKFASQKR